MKDELQPFIDLLVEKNVQSYCEIGARDGDTFHSVMSALPAGSRGVAVDFPGALWGKSTTIKNLQNACDDLIRRGYDIQMIIGDSTSTDVISKVHAYGDYDAILIDGDHTFEGVRSDFMNYGMLAPIVAFHDIVGDGQYEKVTKRHVEVPKLWKMIREEFRTIEFVAPESKMGIGVCLR